jgi:hypothetical protein
VGTPSISANSLLTPRSPHGRYGSDSALRAAARREGASPATAAKVSDFDALGTFDRGGAQRTP